MYLPPSFPSPPPPVSFLNQLGNQLEHHGIRESDLRAWCESSGKLEALAVDRIRFKKEDGEDGTYKINTG